MTGRERVIRALEFTKPDKIPVDAWVLPGAFSRYGKAMEDLCAKHPLDVIQINGPQDHGFNHEYYERGTFDDLWGCTWTNHQPGIIGQVKDHPLADDDTIPSYKAPLEAFAKWWDEALPQVNGDIKKARERGQFVIGGWISFFERMQFLRGTQELYCDIAGEPDNVRRLADAESLFFNLYLDKWLALDIDAVAFGDDWGSERAVLVNPRSFRELFKPHYAQLSKRIKDAGKKLFFHSDGYIWELYDDILDLGTDALNTQVWVEGVGKTPGIERVANAYRGKVCFWGEMDRQFTMPFGTPEQVRAEAHLLRDTLGTPDGGFIGLGTVLHDVSIENAAAMFEGWH